MITNMGRFCLFLYIDLKTYIFWLFLNFLGPIIYLDLL